MGSLDIGEEVEDDRTSSIRAAQELETQGRGAGGSRRQLILAWTVAGLAVAFALTTVLIPGLFENQPLEPPVRFTVLPPSGVRMFPSTNASAISPDGENIVWRGLAKGVSSLYLSSLRSNETRFLRGSELGFLPFWSPDGKSVAFFEGSTLRRLPIDGGDPQAVCDDIVTN